MHKQGFNTKFFNYLQFYLSKRQTMFKFQNNMYRPVNITQRVEQGSCLSSILSEIAIALIIYKIFSVGIPDSQRITTQFFINDGLFHIINNNLETNVHVLKYKYKEISTELYKIGCDIGPEKSELIHFRCVISVV